MLLGGLKHTLLLGVLCLFCISGLPESARAGDGDIKESAQSSGVEKKAQSSKQSEDKGKRKKVRASKKKKKKRRARSSTRVNRFKRDEQRLEEVQLLSELEFVDPSLCVDEATPLHVAAASGDMDVILDLLLEGADIRAEDSWGQTPLMLATEAGHFEAVLVLMDAIRSSYKRKAFNEVFYQENIEGNALLDLAVYGGEPGVVKVILDRVRRNALVEVANGMIAANSEVKVGFLHVAAMHGYLEVVCLFLNRGGDVNLLDGMGRTPLHYAAMEGHADVVQTLLSRGALVSAVDEHQRTPLHFAIEMGHGQVAAVLREALGANGQDASGTLNAADKYKRTPLHYAAMEGNVDEVRALLNAGVAADVYDRWDRSPLHYAAWEGNLAIVQLLLTEVGEDVAFDLISAVDRNGQNSFHLAAQEGHQEVIAFMIAMLNGEPLLRGVLSRRDNQGKTPAEYALNEEHRGIFGLLMQEIHRDSGNMFLSLFDDGASSSTSFGITRSPHFNWN